MRGLTGSVYGRRMYDIMRYWDEDLPEWSAEFRDYAVAWRRQPKWVVSRSLTSVGPNATLVKDDMEAVIRGLKAQLAGEIAVAGPVLAQSLTELGLIDAYQIYLRPVVLGRGNPFFAGPTPPLRLVASDLIGEDAIGPPRPACLTLSLPLARPAPKLAREAVRLQAGPRPPYSADASSGWGMS